MEPRRRVLIAVDTLAAGGAERVAVDIANALDRETHDVTVCSTRFDGPMRAELRSDIDVELLRRRTTWDLRGLIGFRRLVRRRNIDIVHSHGRGTMMFVALLRALGLIDVTHVFHDHYGPLHLDRGAPRRIRAAIRLGVDRYLGVDRRLCAWAMQSVGLDVERVHLTRSSVDVERFTTQDPVDLRTEFDLEGREVVLVMVAHLRQQKDHPTVFRALAELPEETRSRLGIVLVGRLPTEDSYARRCLAMAESLGVLDVLRVAGPRDDTPALLAGADGGLLASKNETGPLVLLEYMASGLPFVATHTGEIACAVRDLGVGFLPAPRDHRDLAGALRLLVEMGTTERQSMGARGRSMARERFDQRHTIGQIERIYGEALDQRSR